jgi:uncharacterized protein (TIGR02147 family)
MSGSTPSIFEYTDYRRYLRDFYAWAKVHKKGFSHRAFLGSAGMAGSAYLKRVMEGQHDLTSDSIAKFAKALDLTSQEKLFFESLVNFNQAQTLADKDRFFKRLMDVKSPHRTAILEPGQYEYYKDWYNVAIREILAFIPYKNNAEEISRHLTPEVSPGKVKKAIELLQRLGLVTQGSDGAWRASASILKTDPSIQSLMIPRFHQSMARLALDAIERYPKDERYFSGSTLSVSPKMYDAIIEKIRALRADILDYVASGEEPEQVYHLNMQLFPLTTGPRKPGRKKK